MKRKELIEEISKYERLANQIFYNYHQEANEKVKELKKELEKKV